MPVSPDGIIVAGEFTRASGLGESARLMVQGLAALGVRVWTVDISALLPAHRHDLPAAEPPAEPAPAGAPLVLHVNPPLLPLVLARLPRTVVRNRHRVGFWSWELQVAPTEWLLGARFVHAAWAPSSFTADALGGLLAQPIPVVRHPIAADPLVPAPVGRAELGLPPTAVVVLTSFNLASSFVRKNPLAAIAAFRAAFGDRTDRILALKVMNGDHFPVDFAQLSAAIAGAPNIRLITQVLSRPDSLALTAAADIVLSLHRSEGFGLVLAEAMLLGKPVVATDWSGALEFMDDSCAGLVRSRLVPVRDPRGVYSVRGALWAEPDIGHAAEWLRRLADHPALCTSLGRRARATAQARLGPASLAMAVQALGVRMDRHVEVATTGA